MTAVLHLLTSVLLLKTFMTSDIAWKCGIKHIDPPEVSGRIIGGKPAEAGEYPWQVSLQFNGFSNLVHFCGGSILNDRWILTAAHCITGFANTEIMVLAGRIDLSKHDFSEQIVPVKKLVLHPDFNRKTAANDIGLLELKKPLTFGFHISPICLPEALQTTTGMGTVTGWGVNEEGGELSDILMKVDVPIISDEECRSEYKFRNLSKAMICAGYPQGGFDACQGDSGGPLVSKNSLTQKYYIAGIVSWGAGCGIPSKAGVYTEVAYFAQWIQNQLRIDWSDVLFVDDTEILE